MIRSRCQGLIVQDRLSDLLDAEIHCDAWRCPNCGDFTDKVILANRQSNGTFQKFKPFIRPPSRVVHQRAPAMA